MRRSVTPSVFFVFASALLGFCCAAVVKIGYLGQDDVSLSASRLAVADINGDGSLLASTTLELVSNTSIALSSNLTSFETVQEMAELVAAGDSNN